MSDIQKKLNNDHGDATWSVFVDRKRKLESSDLFKQISQTFDNNNIDNIDRIRCLGLGSVTSSLLSMYQLCLLNLLEKYFLKNEQKIEVSIWDPIFSEKDKHFITERFNYKIIENDKDDNEKKYSTMFYLPHFPISILETFITTNQPTCLLSNDLTVYTNKFTDSKFFQLYPNSARLAKLILDKNQMKDNKFVKESSINDEFRVVKKKNRKKKSSILYTPPVVDYDFSSAYFKDVSCIIITEGNDLSHPWDSAFTDLTFSIISSK